MYTKINSQSNPYEILCPELLNKISKNNTLDTIVLMGELDTGFFQGQYELFSDAVIGAFQKNNTIKTIIFDKLSLNAIKFLLPALGKMNKLILHNIAPNDVLFISTHLYTWMPIVPEIILQNYDDIEIHANVAEFNARRMELLQSINPLKRKNEGADIELETPKKRRLANEDAMDEEPNINPSVIQLAVLQNPGLFYNFMQFLNQDKNMQHPDSPPSPQSQQSLAQAEHLEMFNKIHQTYLGCAPSLNLDKKNLNIGPKEKIKIRTEFCDLATKNNCAEYKKFIPMLEKRSKSKVFDLRGYALVLAAINGNRDAVNRLLGGRIRMVAGEPTPANIEAVLAEREILLVQRKENVVLKTANLAFKNSAGQYQEETIGRNQITQSLFNNSQTLCRDNKIITSLIKMLRNLNASQNFLKRTNEILAEDLNTAFLFALQHGHLNVLYDILDYINEYDQLVYYKPAVTEENCFYNLVNYLACFTTKKGYTPLMDLLTSHKTNTLLHLKVITETAILYNKPEILDCLFNRYFISDEEINSYFKFALHHNNTMEIQHYFLDANKGFFYSIAAKQQLFAVHVIRNDGAHSMPMPMSMPQDFGMHVYLFISDDDYTLGFHYPNGDKEYGYIQSRLYDVNHISLIKNILACHDNTDMFYTTGWVTRHLRLLLVSLGINSLFQYDPVELAKLMDNRDARGKGSICCADINSLNLFMQHAYFDLSQNDNQFLKSLAALHTIPVLQSPGTPNQLHGLGHMMVHVLNDLRVNPLQLALEDDLDFYTSGIKCSIEKGYTTVLPLLLYYKPEGSLILSEMFLKYPQLMKNALHSAMQNGHAEILSIVEKNLYFFQPTLEVRRQMRALVLRYNEISQMLQQHNLSENDKMLLCEEQKAINATTAPHIQQRHEMVLKNNKIISVLLSSPLVFKSKTPEQWKVFFEEIKKQNIAISEGVIDYVIGWPKIKVWSELRCQQGFFARSESNQNQFMALPREILDEIETKFLSVHRL